MLKLTRKTLVSGTSLIGKVNYIFEMAAVPPAALDPVTDLKTVLALCGITSEASKNKLIDLEGLSSIHDLAQISDVEVDNMAKRCEARQGPNKVSFGLVRIKKFKAVTFWARKAKRAGKDLDVNELNAQKLSEWIDEMSLMKEDKTASDKLYPEKFNHQKFKSWALSFENYLDSKSGMSGVPLSYIIRKDEMNPDEAKNEHEVLIWLAPLLGTAFIRDNREVIRF